MDYVSILAIDLAPLGDALSVLAMSMAGTVLGFAAFQYARACGLA